jgi:hypothetical protein
MNNDEDVKVHRLERKTSDDNQIDVTMKESLNCETRLWKPFGDEFVNITYERMTRNRYVERRRNMINFRSHGRFRFRYWLQPGFSRSTIT